jgi:hypothetical protein
MTLLLHGAHEFRGKQLREVIGEFDHLGRKRFLRLDLP